MKINVLASGSSGNCIAIQSGDSCILIDVGIAKTKIEKRLNEVGIRPDSIEAIFITHAHSDHVKGLPIANKYKIPVYAGEGEWKSINSVDGDLRKSVNVRQRIAFEDFLIRSFQTHHDAYDPRGYVISTNDSKVSVCLDTGHTDEEMLQAMKGSDTYIIESNHEPNMVEVSNYPNSVKARILSHIGHLSNMQTAEALTSLVEGHGEKIYLTHLSSHNNMSVLAEITTVRALMKKGLKKDIDYKIEVIR